MYIRIQHLAILYTPLSEAVFASSVGGLCQSTTPGPSLTTSVTRSSVFHKQSNIHRGNWSEMSLAEFESWIESQVDDLDSLRISGVSLAAQEHLTGYR